jgi:hypothetical protein
MKNTEVNAAILGKLMVASAVVESKAYQTSPTQVDPAFTPLINLLIELY